MTWELVKFDANTETTLVQAAAECGVAYSTLAQAAREGRLEARKSGGIWLTTLVAVQEAIEAGKLRPRNKEG